MRIGRPAIQGAFSDSATSCALRTHSVRLQTVLAHGRISCMRPCAISNQSHCKIPSKRVTSALCFALHQREMRNAALRGYYDREPYEFSTNSNPCSTSHEASVTHPLVSTTTNVSNGTCSAMDQSLSYGPLGEHGVASIGELGRMLGM